MNRIEAKDLILSNTIILFYAESFKLLIKQTPILFTYLFEKKKNLR